MGQNSAGELGTGNTSQVVSPTEATVDTNSFISVAMGSAHTAAVASDGTLWTIGSNSNGQLGNGTTTSSTSWIQVGTLNNWTAVYAGSNYTVAMNKTQQAYGFGQNTYGQFGKSNNTDLHTPTNLNGSMSGIVSVACGAGHIIMINNYGQMFAAGLNTSGQLGGAYGNNYNF